MVAKFLQVVVLEPIKDQVLEVREVPGLMAMVTKALAQLVEIRDMVLTVREVTLEREVLALMVQMLDQIRVKEVREVTAIKEPATKEVPALSRVLVDLTVVVLRFLEVRTLLPVLHRKSPAVVTVTPTVLDSASPVTATVSPSTVSSLGWWQF